MDDYISGANSDNEAEIMHRDVAKVLESGGMLLRKWCSNSEQMRRIFSETSNVSHYSLNLSPDETTTSLGLNWCPTSDTLLFLNKSEISRLSKTKRELLSTLNSVFDPLGFLGPVLIRGKVFLQELWQLKIEWDDELPSHIQTRWRLFLEDLNNLSKLKIPRLAKINNRGRIELHGFCDALQIAFGACIYLRQLTGAGTWGVHLLCAKSRVAPTKTLTISRLELSGALLLSELMCRVSKAINVSLDNIYCWCDSTVVLAWINGVPAQWKTYVANRVTQIIENVGAGSWRHISTHQNPADPLSRGVTTQVLLDLNIWWYGPSFLNTDAAAHAHSPEQFPVNVEASRELRPIRYTLMTIVRPKPLLELFSKWDKLLRISAIWYRFFKWLRHRSHPDKPQPLTGPLPVSELRLAEEAWVVYAQRQAFPNEIKLLSNGDDVMKGPLKNLSPFLDGNILRVGGRLRHSNEPFSRKHPALLPRKHRVTKLIVQAYHLRFLHMGPSGMLTNIRLHFWPLRGRDVARQIVNQCQRCLRARPIPMQPVMGQPPSARVSVSRPFTHTGVDFAGPITIRVGLWKSVPVKAYVAVFVCLSTKAIHLEAVSDLSADAFMACLRRFISRRGVPSHIWSDNGTNFVGTQRILRQYYTAQRTGHTVHEDLVSEGLQWIFIPPGAPHFGGLWEAAVKSCKHHLVRTVAGVNLNFEELSIVLAQIEACLNSRPLTALSSDPSDCRVLTPNHFLLGGSSGFLPESDVTDVPSNRLKKWIMLQKLQQGFWLRWRSEYLSSLQQQNKWLKKSANIRIGTLAILVEDNIPPLNWRMVRIEATHPGSDGVVRVATVRTANGSLMKRPVTKLCPLPDDA